MAVGILVQPAVPRAELPGREESLPSSKAKASALCFSLLWQKLLLERYLISEQTGHVLSLPTAPWPSLCVMLQHISSSLTSFPCYVQTKCCTLDTHAHTSLSLDNGVSQPHISGSCLVWSEHRACQTTILSQHVLPKHFSQALVSSITVA